MNRALREKIVQTLAEAMSNGVVTTTEDVMRFIKKNFNIQIAKRTSFEYKVRASEIMIGNVVINPIDQDPEKTKFTVDHSGYTIRTKQGDVQVSIEMADRLMYEYSEHGLNMTQVEIINKYRFTPVQFHAIKSALGMYKKANIFCQFTMDNLPKEEIAERTEKLISNALDDRNNIKNIYDRTVTKKSKEQINAVQSRELAKQILSIEISNLLAESSIQKVSILRNKESNLRPIVVNTADWHVGAEVSGLHKTKDYSPEILESYIEQIGEITSSYCSSDVTLVINGDIIESFTGKMHKNQFMSIAKGYYGSKVVVEAYKMILLLASKIENLKTIVITGGNHDRFSDDNDFDVNGEIAEIISYMVATTLKDNVTVIYSNGVVSQEIDGINYVWAHGHKKRDAMPADRILFKYGRQSMFNMIIHAHKHTREINKDDLQYRVLRLPSLFTGNSYSEDLGFSTLGGFVITYNNGKGYPVTVDHPLAL
jgi:hypothetical protein